MRKLIVFALLVYTILSIDVFADKSDTLHQAVKSIFGVDMPDSANNVLIVGETSHNDYDWTGTFTQYYSLVEGGIPKISKKSKYNYLGVDVKTVFDGNSFSDSPDIYGYWEDTAGAFSSLADTDYKYAICEIVFLKRFLDDAYAGKTQTKPEKITDASNLWIEGGGMVSPSSLCSYGEAIIRNQLLGTMWVEKNLTSYMLPKGRKIKTLWLPDDFGLDPNLPALMQAMELKNVVFSRIAGTNDSQGDPKLMYDFYSNFVPQPRINSPADQLLKTYGNNFNWQSSDSSKVFAHWLAGGYQQCSVETSAQSQKRLQNNITHNNNIFAIEDATHQLRYFTPGGSAVNNINYIPVSDDMMPVCLDLVTIVKTFNDDLCVKNSTFAICGSFDQFQQLYSQMYSEDTIKTVKTYNYNPTDTKNYFRFTPVMAGFYASCPLIKQLHKTVCDKLLAAEVFTSIQKQFGIESSVTLPPVTDYNGNIVQNTIQNGWQLFVPSTHHAYVTGLSTNDVYSNEQLPELKNAEQIADDNINNAVNSIAENISSDNDNISVTVFNQLGFNRDHCLVKILHDEAHGLPITKQISADSEMVQVNSDSSIEFFVNDIPAFGYKTIKLSYSDLPDKPVYKMDPVTKTADRFVINNGVLTVTISKIDGSITQITDNATNTELLQAAGNGLYIYDENGTGQIPSGNEYSFQYEFYDFNQAPNAYYLPKLDNVTNNIPFCFVAEDGPLKKVIVCMNINDAGKVYKCLYTIIVGSPYVGISVTGNAYDANTSIFTKFPLFKADKDVNRVTYGTPYHWITEPSKPLWNPYPTSGLTSADFTGPFFKGTFNFMLAKNSAGNIIAAIYNKGVPCWAYNNGVIYGSLWRNVPLGLYNDTDSFVGAQEAVTCDYAIRIPQGLDDASTGQPLKESLNYQYPPIPVVLKPQQNGNLNDGGSLASVSGVGGQQDANVIITAAKQCEYDANDLILRIYNPTNISQTFAIHANGNPYIVNALEQPYVSGEVGKINGNVITMPYSLMTLRFPGYFNSQTVQKMLEQ